MTAKVFGQLNYVWLSRWTDRLAWPVGILLSVAGIGLAAGQILATPNWPLSGTDLGVYLHAAHAVATGQNMFDPAFNDPANPYAYPPLFAEFLALLRPILGDGKLWIIWSMFGAGCLFVSLALLMRHSGVKLGWKWVVLAFGALSIGRLVRSDLYHVQPHFILLLLIIVGVRFFAINRNRLGGLAWALVFCCKPFTGALVFGLMRNGNWRAFFASVIAAGAIFVASFVPFMPNVVDGIRGWLHASSFHTGLPDVTKVANETFYGTFHRLFDSQDGINSSPWISAPEIIPALAILFLAIAVAGVWFGVVTKSELKAIPAQERPARDLLQASVVLGFTMSCGPLMEAPHVFMLLPGVAASAIIAWRRWLEDSPVKWRWIAATGMWALTFSVFLIPFVKIVSFYTLGHISGPMILITARFGVLVLASCLLSVFAQLGDRAVQCGRTRLSFSRPQNHQAVS